MEITIIVHGKNQTSSSKGFVEKEHEGIDKVSKALWEAANDCHSKWTGAVTLDKVEK